MAKRKNKDELDSLLNFIAEAGMLKRTARSGWAVLGIKGPESVAGHSFRCAVLGYVLAVMEGVDPYRVLSMSLFHDIHEARITDLHKMAQRYMDLGKIEDKVFLEQVSSLPDKVKKGLSSMRREYNLQETKESIIVRDADILECLIQAKEYTQQGFSQAEKFMKKAPVHLKTSSARKLWKTAKDKDFNSWWFKLSEFKR